MAQHDYVIDNASGATVRADINSALSAIQSLNSGTSAPSSTVAGMLWLDTTGGAPYTLKIRDAGNNHWLTLGNVTDPGADGNLELLPGKINLPSSGGVYESDGSTEILTESSGTVSLKNTSINANNVFPAGHIIQSVFSPTITNKNSGTDSGSSELAVMDVRGQITLSSSSNGVLVFFNAWVYTNGNTNSYGKIFIRKGTTASLSTILVSQRYGDANSGDVYGPISAWGFDASPGSTTPDYVFTIERDSGGTSGTIFLDNADTTRCHLFEVKQ